MIAATIASSVRLMCGASVSWRCEPTAAKQRIYFGNHSSHLDFVMIWASLPPRLRKSVRPVAGRDYWERSAVRRYLAANVFRAVLIDRGHAGADKTAASASAAVHLRAPHYGGQVEQMAHEMADRFSLIVFPEGTRSLDGEIGAFKSGLFHLSRLRPDVELVPVYLENLNRILPKGQSLPVPMMSRVIFGPALATAGVDDKTQFLQKARESLLQLKDSQ